MQKAAGIAAIVAMAVVTLAKILDSPQQPKSKQQKKEKLEQQLISQFVDFTREFKPIQKNGKNYICFIGPTSAGKSTLCNQLFDLKLPTGIGRTTPKAQRIYSAKTSIYFDAPGMNNDWQLYTNKDVQFFNSIDKCFLLYVGQIREVKFIGKLLSKMGKQLIFVRNQCDKHTDIMKPIDAVLEQDRDDLSKLSIKYQAVIASGMKNREQIKKWIN